MSSSTSSNATVLLLHEVSHLGCTGVRGLNPLVTSGCVLLLTLDAEFAPLFLRREKSGIVLVRSLPWP